MHRGGEDFEVPGEDLGPVRQRLAGGPLEIWEGPQGLEPAGEDAPEGGDGATSVCHVLSGGGPGSPNFRAETWVLSETMSRKLEGVHVGFLRQITGQRVEIRDDGTWPQVAADKFLEKAGTQYLGDYIERRQESVTEWVALRTILEVCDREIG